MSNKDGEFYVYAHCTEEGEIVYVGKGTFERAAYVYKRKPEHEAFMRNAIKTRGFAFIVFLANGLTEREAFVRESALIKEIKPLYNLAGK